MLLFMTVFTAHDSKTPITPDLLFCLLVYYSSLLNLSRQKTQSVVASADEIQKTSLTAMLNYWLSCCEEVKYPPLCLNDA